MDMELLRFLYILVVLFPVRAAHSNKTSPGLHCTNDFVNNVSCTWVGSPHDSGEDCWISGVKKIWNRPKRTFDPFTQRCEVKRHIKSPPGCSFVFENDIFHGFEEMPSISLECNGTLIEKLVNYMPRDHIKMNPPSAPEVDVTMNETRISWSPGSPVSYLLESRLDFEVQVTKNNRSWEEARKFFPSQQQELNLSSWQLRGDLQVRVRVKPINRNNSQWSNWSPVTSWKGPTDKVDTTKKQELEPEQTSLMVLGLMLTVCFTVVIFLSLQKHCKTRRLLMVKPVPDPSNYFHSLHSVHGGNLKKWLNPLPVSDSFFTPQSHDQISSVEVCKDWNGVPLLSPSSSFNSAQIRFHGYPSSGSNSNGVACNSSSLSDYSNMGYFMSSSSAGSAQSNPAYITYQDDFQKRPDSLGAPLPSCPSYESLKRVPESPDSGFGIAMENEMELARYTDTEGENVLDRLVSPVLILPLHLPSHSFPPSSPPPPPTVAATLSDSQQAAGPEAADSGSPAARPAPAAMCRSSSMPAEPSQTGYLTLKELHTTFSNKSI